MSELSSVEPSFIIRNSKSGNTITIYDIRAKRTDAKNTEPVGLDPLVIEIK